MVPLIRKAALLLCFLLLAVPVVRGVEIAPFRGNWTCVALDNKHLVLTGDYREVQNRLFQQKLSERRRSVRRLLTGWAADLCFELSAVEAISAYRPPTVALLMNHPAIVIESQAADLAVASVGYWLNPVGQSQFPDEKGQLRFARTADAAHHLFLTLSRPLAEGEEVAITLPAGEKVNYVWSVQTPSPLFKFNQVGYLPEAKKYAYVGAWLGTAGPLPLHKQLDGKEFLLVDAETGQTVFTGVIHSRMADPVNAAGTPFTGEEVLELDFSEVKTPGVYRLVIPGLASSDRFRIGNDTMAEAFYIHARGLYHQRCGIAKTEPFTHWTQRACHLSCRQGSFPPDINHYGPGAPNRPYGFTDSTGKSVKVNHFELIRQNQPPDSPLLNAPGGWHDAADWDRRPQHMGIVGDLAAVYLLKPENFGDGQLDLPESGNGIPDILDEACWGLEHLRRKQQSDGGVGTWVETIRHPRPGEGMASDDQLTYYLSGATKNSSLEYAAYAAQLALALKKAGADEAAARFTDSARRAWDFALNPAKRPPRVFVLNGQTLFYREDEELTWEFLIKSGYDLYLLTGNAAYLDKAAEVADAADQSMKKNSWRYSPLLWIELEIFPPESVELEKLRASRAKSIVRAADKLLEQQEDNYPIRVPWYGPKDGWVHTMSWGTYHPLVRARMLIAAHAITNDEAYRLGALLANDFTNGANPSGSSMTSGLGRVYPVRFLDLNSYADGIAEAVPGITPFRNTYGIPRGAVKMAYGLYYRKRPEQGFAGLAVSLLPGPGLDEDACAKGVGQLLPIWRRWCNVEAETVAASEYSVWETIGPNAAVTGYLLNGAMPPDPSWAARRPVDDISRLPGYHPLP